MPNPSMPSPPPHPARLPCVAKPFDPDDSHLDEALGYVLAAAGFVFQLQAGTHTHGHTHTHTRAHAHTWTHIHTWTHAWAWAWAWTWAWAWDTHGIYL